VIWIKRFQTVPTIEVGLLVRTTPDSGGLFLGLPLIGADHQSITDTHPSFLAAVSLGDLSLIGAVDVLQTRPEGHRLF
jgi:hypothetical protein